MALKKIPLRTCIGCGLKKPKNELISIIKSPKAENTASFEVFEKNVKKDGRSAYICKNIECLKKATKYRKLEKSFKCKIDKEIYDSIENIINRSEKNIGEKISKIEIVTVGDKLKNFLGIVKKSGNIILGMDCVKEGISEGNIKLILTTSDISDNSLEEIGGFSFSNGIRLFKISLSKDDIFDMFGKYSAIIGIKNENFVKKIMEMIDMSLADTEIQNAKSNREECNI